MTASSPFSLKIDRFAVLDQVSFSLCNANDQRKMLNYCSKVNDQGSIAPKGDF